MTARFHIKENGILDRSRNDKRLNPVELCNTLNALDCIADKNVDEYSYIKRLECENEQLKQQINELKEDVPLLLAFYRWYPFAVEKKEHQSYNRLWDFVND